VLSSYVVGRRIRSCASCFFIFMQLSICYIVYFPPWIMRLGRETDHLPSFGAEVKNAWSYRPTSTPSYFLVAWFLNKHRDNIIISSSTSTTSSTSGGRSVGIVRSRTKATGFSLVVVEVAAVLLEDYRLIVERRFFAPQ
jgi:hypothetical protein